MEMKAMKRLLLSILTLMIGFVGSSLIVGAQATNSTQTQKPAVVFDLGGVLFDTDSAVVKNEQIGKYLAVRFALMNFSFSGKAMKKRWFAVLNQVANNNNHTFAFHNEDGTPIEVKDEHGTIIPSYMLEWMAGDRSNELLFNEVAEGIEALDTLSSADKKFMINLTKVFLPELFVASRKPIAQTVALLKSLQKKGYPLYVLSNWDRESFEKMLQKYPEIFALFDGYIVSGIVQLAKPDPRIYQELERQFPHRGYIFIDDQKDNIATARECGWDALRVKPGALNKKKMKHSIAALSIATVENRETASA
jgi:HAD superfamily hydrolase (TIGR01509 family)